MCILALIKKSHCAQKFHPWCHLVNFGNRVRKGCFGVQGLLLHRILCMVLVAA